MIYHLTFRKNWRYALATGPYRDKSLDKEGFIHCSTAEQLVPVAMNFFPARRKLTVLVMDETRLLTGKLARALHSCDTVPCQKNYGDAPGTIR